jgi:hypothetical protein
MTETISIFLNKFIISLPYVTQNKLKKTACQEEGSV